MHAKKHYLLLLWAGLSLCLGGQTEAQISVRRPIPPLPKETYSLRVENVQYGRVEISLDRGVHRILIGRVMRPAAQATSDKAATVVGTIVRAQGDGLAFCVAPGRILKLLPASAPGKPKGAGKKAPAPGSAALLTDMTPSKGLLGDLLLPPTGTVVGAIADMPREAPFPSDYFPALEDVFVFHVRLPLPAANANGQTEGQREEVLAEAVRVQATALQKEYAAGAVARARAARRKVVSGILTLRATLPEGEPDPITAVTYMVDGQFTAAQDTAPFVYAWNTRNVEDGEHVVEIRAVNHDARPITRVRVLVVVQNTPSPAPTSAASKPPSPPSSP